MKKRTLILAVIISTLTGSAFAYKKWPVNENQEDSIKTKSKTLEALVSSNFLSSINKKNPNDLIYKIDTRFTNQLSPLAVKSAKTIMDLLPEGATDLLSDYENSTVGIYTEEKEYFEVGKGIQLTNSQKELLRNIDHTTNIFVKSRCKKKNTFTGQLENHFLVNYLSVTPEKQAKFAAGNEVLIQRIKNKIRPQVSAVEKDLLKSGQIHFTVSNEGLLKDISLKSTTGYPEIDESLLHFFKSIEGNWIPAVNNNGEATSQELVFFFGRQGC